MGKPLTTSDALEKSQAGKHALTPKPLESYTAEEQEILQVVVRNEGKEAAEKNAPFVLEQARVIGALGRGVIMRTVEFWDWGGLCAWVYLESGDRMSDDCRPGQDQTLAAIRHDSDRVGRTIWANTHPVE